MARNLMTESGAPQAASTAQTPDTTATRDTLPADRPAPQPAGEVLAGAFPDWNLLPATPFLRRVR